jgi:hypothetical protein
MLDEKITRVLDPDQTVKRACQGSESIHESIGSDSIDLPVLLKSPGLLKSIESDPIDCRVY